VPGVVKTKENFSSVFARALGWRLRFWLLGLPAGVGWGTLRAVIKLWLGFSPRHSGVRSAGNGPAMRAALFGVCLGDHPDRLRAYVRASTRLTHTDPRAERGALLVALAAHYGARQGSDGFKACAVLNSLCQGLGECDAELGNLLDKTNDHLERDAPAEELAVALGLRRGITGYIYHTVPVALYCWLRSPGDFRRAVEEAIDLGGDTDTLGAIVGGLVGATVGAKNIPEEWLAGLVEWPRSVAWMRRLAARLAEQFMTDDNKQELGPVPLFWPGLLPRNLLFLLVVLAHGFRRLLPPY
jgi:ADP-ribosylglycohydrolase